MWNLEASLFVAREEVTQSNVLLQVTTGPNGEIVALGCDRYPFGFENAAPPYTYTITAWRDGHVTSLRLDNVSLRLSRIQPYGDDAFLVVSPLSNSLLAPNGFIIGTEGETRRKVAVSRGTQQLQVDSAGNVWIGYSDQGILSGFIIPIEGLVCFTPRFEPIVRFSSLARRHGLPFMDDCESLNVASDRDVYTCYWAKTEYRPLVHLRDGDIVDAYQITGVSVPQAFAIAGTHALVADSSRPSSRLALVDLTTGRTEEAQAIDQQGQPILVGARSGVVSGSYPAWGRGDILYLLDARGVWTVRVPDI